ncbi:hypothetical protein [Zafaria cholistanensis]|uniref:hypothetical protein n=1 Tax=Zafaria cholistanensis TaxID=1682741 RepID=UPI001230E7E7|nr:hypothetical protein [Zafaria cholistanensis]
MDARASGFNNFKTAHLIGLRRAVLGGPEFGNADLENWLLGAVMNLVNTTATIVFVGHARDKGDLACQPTFAAGLLLLLLSLKLNAFGPSLLPVLLSGAAVLLRLPVAMPRKSEGYDDSEKGGNPT